MKIKYYFFVLLLNLILCECKLVNKYLSLTDDKKELKVIIDAFKEELKFVTKTIIDYKKSINDILTNGQIDKAKIIVQAQQKGRIVITLVKIVKITDKYLDKYKINKQINDYSQILSTKFKKRLYMQLSEEDIKKHHILKGLIGVFQILKNIEGKYGYNDLEHQVKKYL